MAHARSQFDFKIPPDAKAMQFQAGLVLPTEMVLTCPDRDGYDLETTIALDREPARFVCRELRIRQRAGGPPVTGNAIRAIPVRELVRAAIRMAHFEEKERTAGSERQFGLVSGAKPPEGLAKQGFTDELLRWVSQIYNLAVVVNEPPAKRVQEELGVSRATAGRWVAEARTRGLIPPLDEDSNDGGR